MKGQYLAVETVFTFGLGLIVAIGIITLFNQYKTDVLAGAEPHQVDMIQSEIGLALDTLREADGSLKNSSGRYTMELPDNIAGKSYTIDMEKPLVINVGDKTYKRNLTGYKYYNLKGGASGGDLTIFKQGNNFTMRAQ